MKNVEYADDEARSFHGQVVGINDIIPLQGTIMAKLEQAFKDSLPNCKESGKQPVQLYFAGPLFNQAERQFNEQLCSQLEKMGISIFLPQRDGAESSKSLYKEMSKDERRRAMFILDRDEILAADIFLFILDGRVPDEGACVELGIAYGQKFLAQKKKLLIGLRTDKRTAFAEAGLNPMISQALDKVFLKEDDLLSYFRETISQPAIV